MIVINLSCWETENPFPLFFFIVIATFCNGKLEGFYEDPSDCQAFFQCLNGKSTKRFCLKGMVFNPMLKTCDSPRNFACREHPAAPEVNNMTAGHGRDQGRENGAEPSQLSSSISGKQFECFCFILFFGLFTCLHKIYKWNKQSSDITDILWLSFTTSEQFNLISNMPVYVIILVNSRILGLILPFLQFRLVRFVII